VKIGVVSIRPEGEEFSGELQHVVHVAGLGRSAVHAIVETVGFAEVLVFAVAAGGITVVLDDTVPEKPCGESVTGVASQSESGDGTDHFWDLGIAVFAGQIVLMAHERKSESAVLELI